MELFNMRGIVTVLLLIFGIVLTVVTIRRMAKGQINLPGWVKVLLSAAMIVMMIITLLGILPPISIDDPFVNEYTEGIAPLDPSIESETSQ